MSVKICVQDQNLWIIGLWKIFVQGDLERRDTLQRINIWKMFNLKGGILLCGVFIGLTDSKAGDTPNQKMKKLYRNGIEIMNIMANFAVEKVGYINNFVD
jgi:hypothetical protein